jgi:IS5 family transposase
MHACGNLPSTILQATILYTPSSTRNASGDRAPEMHETRRGKQGYFEMKAHTGVDAKEGHGHSMATSSRGLHMLPELLHARSARYGATAAIRARPKR